MAEIDIERIERALVESYIKRIEGTLAEIDIERIERAWAERDMVILIRERKRDREDRKIFVSKRDRRCKEHMQKER